MRLNSRPRLSVTTQRYPGVTFAAYYPGDAPRFFILYHLPRWLYIRPGPLILLVPFFVITLYRRRTSRLFAALLVPLLAISIGSAQARELRNSTTDSLATSVLPADTLAAEVQKPRPTRLTPMPMDSLPHIHPRDAGGRITDYTVAPGVTWHYDKPKAFSWAYHIPRDLGQFPGYAFRKENKEMLVELLAGSVALWVADQAIVDWSQDVGRSIHLKSASTQKSLVSIPFHIGVANLPLEFNVPDNLNSTFYFLGDGWTHLTVASGFWIYGGIKKDNRALRTSSQLGEAIFSTGLVVQGLKRITGRQSPFVSSKPRGEWHLFPSYNTYQSSVPKHDAFPTGHLATAMATVTVIAENYPEYHFIRPVGYGLMGLLGYAMLNNGVHWASDYPIGIAIGYGFAKIAVRNGRTRVETPDTDSATPGTGFRILPHPKPWYRRGLFSPYNYGPFTGASWSIRL